MSRDCSQKANTVRKTSHAIIQLILMHTEVTLIRRDGDSKRTNIGAMYKWYTHVKGFVYSLATDYGLLNIQLVIYI